MRPQKRCQDDFWTCTQYRKYENTTQLFIISKGMRSIYQRINPQGPSTTYDLAASYCVMTAYIGQIAKWMLEMISATSKTDMDKF